MDFIPFKIPASCQIALFGDTHEGSIYKHKEGVKEVIKWVLDSPKRYAVHMGDLAEAITIKDRRYDPSSIDPESPLPLDQYRNAYEELLPLKKGKRLITILDGNHDKTISPNGEFVRDVCFKLKVRFGTSSCKIMFQDRKGNTRFKFFLAHGRKSLSSSVETPEGRLYAMQRALKKQLKDKASDCILMAKGHNHKLVIAPPIHVLEMRDNGKEIKQYYKTVSDNPHSIDANLRWFCSTGSFLKLYGPLGVSGYAEEAEYDPTEMGYIQVDIENYQVVNCRKVVL
jgi:hypothetical protein